MAIANEDLQLIRRLTSAGRKHFQGTQKLGVALPRLNTSLEVNKSRSDPPSPPPGPPPSPSRILSNGDTQLGA